jgi:heme exporter protein B
MTNNVAVLQNMIRRDLRIYRQKSSDYLNSIVIYIIILSLFPLVSGSIEQSELWIVPCLVWIAILLSNTLSQEFLFRDDFKLGVYEQLVISKHSLSLILTTKVWFYWLSVNLPIILITPIICYAFNLPLNVTKIIVVSLLLGTPTLCFLGAVIAALTITAHNSSMLLTLLLLPLYTPVLILGASSAILALQGVQFGAQLALLGAFTVVTLMLAPIAMSAAIKANIS